MARGIDITRLFGRTPAISETGVITKWKGLTVYRKKPGDIISMTPAQQAIRDKLTELSAQWMSELTDEQRSLWNIYAHAKENLSQWDYIMSSTQGIIPKKKNIMSGFNAFISSNALITSIGETDLRKKPPTTEKLTPPIITSLTATPTRIRTIWVDPKFLTTPDVVKVRIWYEGLGKAHKQIVGYKNIGIQIINVLNIRTKLGDTVPILSLSLRT